MKTISSALLWSSMKNGKSGPEKCYYLLLSNNGSIGRCPVFDNMREEQEIKITGWPGCNHAWHTEWKVKQAAKIFPYRKS